MKTVKKPCISCVYFATCGNTTRTEPCKGRETKSEKKRKKQNFYLIGEMDMKNILKSGMIVELRNGVKYLVVENYLIGYLGHMCLTVYNSDLTYPTDYQRRYTAQINSTITSYCSEYDVMKIWTQKDMSNLASMLEDKTDSWVNRFGELIYDRDKQNDETVEMTVEEICKLLGKNVIVV